MEGLKISFDASFWLFAILCLVTNWQLYLTFLTCLVLHELGHVLVAKSRFYTFCELKFTMFGAVLYSKGNAKGFDAIAIALAGPFINLCLAIVCLALWWIAPATYVYLENFLYANLTLGLCNLIPCFPMDGGRVLLGILQLTNVKNQDKIVMVLAQAIAISLFFAFIVSLFFVPLYSLGLFAFFLMTSSFQQTPTLSFYSAGCLKGANLRGGMEKKTLVFNWNAKIYEVTKRMKNGFLYQIEVVNDHFQVVSRLDFNELDSLLTTSNGSSTLKSLLKLT